MFLIVCQDRAVVDNRSNNNLMGHIVSLMNLHTLALLMNLYGKF